MSDQPKKQIKINAFDVLKRMGEEDREICLGTDVLQIDKVKAGTKFTVGIGGDWVAGFLTGQRAALLIVYNTKQYKEVLAKIERENAERENDPNKKVG